MTAGRRTGSRGRVLLVHPSSELYGSDRMLVESAISLASAGAEVRVALPQDGPLVAALHAAGIEVCTVGTVVLRKAFLSPTGLLRLAGQTVRTLPGMVRLLRECRPDIVYVNTVTLPLWMLAARACRVPVVAHVHEAEDGVHRVLALALDAPLLLARAVLVNSRAAQASLFAVLPQLAPRIRLLYNGVAGPAEPATAVRPGLTGEIGLVLVGRLSPRKGTDVAVAAVALLRERGHDVRLSLVGEVFPGYEWFERDLRVRVNAAGLDDHVGFAGFCDDIWPQLAGADIVLVPSRAEPFGNVAVEAGLAGRPVVAAAVQGLCEIVEPGVTGLLVAPGDPGALADAVVSLIEDWPAACELAAEARVRAVGRFGTARYALALLEILADCGLGRG